MLGVGCSTRCCEPFPTQFLPVRPCISPTPFGYPPGCRPPLCSSSLPAAAAHHSSQTQPWRSPIAGCAPRVPEPVRAPLQAPAAAARHQRTRTSGQHLQPLGVRLYIQYRNMVVSTPATAVFTPETTWPKSLLSPSACCSMSLLLLYLRKLLQ